MQPPEDFEASARELFDEYLVLSEAGVEFEEWVRQHPSAEEDLRAMRRRLGGPAGGRGGETSLLSPTAFFHVERSGRTPGSREEPASLNLQPDCEVDDYRLIRRLGEGGMGEVWEAEQLTLARRVALKFMRPRGEEDAHTRLFAREARAGGRLNHRGIVAVYASGESRGLHWIAQELVEGGSTLYDFLRTTRAAETLPRGFDRDVAELIRRLADALHFAHQAGVLHRDLKPRNILIDPRGEPKIGDFGLARIVDEPTQLGAGAVVGTYTYMSPEQVQGQPVDARTDVFSLGVILFEMLTGTRPFGGESREEIMIAITTHEATNPRTLRHTIPPELAVISLHALEKNPADRFQSADELAQEIGRFLRDEPIHTRPPGSLRRAVKWTRRHPTAGVGVVLGVGLLIAIALAWRSMVNAELERVASERDRYYESAGRYFAVADVERGLSEIRQGIDLDPEDPTGHLIAAAGLANAGRLREAEDELKRADRLGFDGEIEGRFSAQQHLALGLYPVVTRNLSRYEEGILHLERAVEDSRVAPLAWYPLYSLRRTVGDEEGAREALEQYLRSVPSGAPMYSVLRAEHLEMQGHFAQALAVLDEVIDDPVRAAQLGGIPTDRRRGRLLTELGRLVEAEAALERAVLSHLVDASSMANLALVNHRLANRGDCPGPERDERRQRARELVLQALASDPRLPHGWALRGTLALAALQPYADELIPGEDKAWDEVVLCMEQLRKLNPTNHNADQLESALMLMEGHYYERNGRGAEAVAHFARSAELNPDQVMARIRLGRMLCSDEQYGAALVELRAANSLLEDGPQSHLVDLDVLRVFHLDLLAAATDASDIELAHVAREELEFQLDEGTLRNPLEVLYFAWSLATAEDDEIRDLALGCALVEDVRGVLSGLGEPSIDEMIAEVDDACER